MNNTEILLNSALFIYHHWIVFALIFFGGNLLAWYLVRNRRC